MRYDVLDLVHWSLTHGIIMSCKQFAGDHQLTLKVTHAPFTLKSYNYPREAFGKAERLAPIFNNLIHKVSLDHVWLQSALQATVQSDNFTGKLMDIYKIVLKEGIKQKINLGINRSDYMLHQVKGDDRSLLQVEVNTIASSFGALSTRIADMYQTFELKASSDTCSIPINSAVVDIARGIASAHDSYRENHGEFLDDNVLVIMVVQPNERNIADQRMLQYEIEQHGVKVVRASLNEIFLGATLDPVSGELLFLDSRVSVVYFRAGYTPDDYVVTGTDNEWAARLLVERSLAIKCPNIAYHLAGTKKVQQALALPGVLEHFLLTDDLDESDLQSAQSDIKLLRSVFAGLYSLDTVDGQDLSALKVLAIASPDNYVLKPQREGGGNNLYGDEIVHALQTMTASELSAFILMERIRPPHQQAVLVRDCVPNEVTHIIFDPFSRRNYIFID
jgi:glutathione synthase